MGKEANEQMGKGFVLEEVTDLDAAWPELEHLVLGIVDYHRPWDGRMLRQDWAPIMRDYMREQCITWLARRSDGPVVAFLSGTIKSDFGIFEGTTGHVDNLFVVEPARGQGIGQSLYNAFEARCRSLGAGEVRLDVAIGNELGDRFWQRAGFDYQMREMRKPLEATS